jgi:aldose 1-epimerase
MLLGQRFSTDRRFPSGASAMPIHRAPYGQSRDGEPVELFTLEQPNGLRARLTNFGAILVGLDVPDRGGQLADVTLGYDELAGWLENPAYMGATVGRYGNRIANARFELEEQTHRLTANEGSHHIHGGQVGFHKRLWLAEPFEEPHALGVRLTYSSSDGEEGYPGNLQSAVTYRLTQGNELRIDFTASTDRSTVINLVHHSYWNLSGQPSRTVLDHELELNADRYLPVDEEAIPLGAPEPVEGTAMDFRQPTTVGARIGRAPGGGYDHNFVLHQIPQTEQIQPAAKLYEPTSGRSMELLTNQPGVQFYAGLYLDGSIVGKGGVRYPQHGGLCLETQRWPDSPNRPGFPSPVLRPGEMYHHVMIHRFGVR